MTLYILVGLLATFILACIYALDKRMRRYMDKRSSQLHHEISSWGFVLEQRLLRALPNRMDGNEHWVVMATRNRNELLQKTVESIIQSEPAVKIFVVDNGSTDATAAILEQLVLNGKVNRFVRHAPNSVPQWQKGYALAEVFGLLSCERVASVTVVDDDMEFSTPWISDALEILNNPSLRCSVVNLHDDEQQLRVHSVRGAVDIGGRTIQTSATFNGAAFMVLATTINRWGLPPVAEGINDKSVEDWYYSRCAKHEGTVAAILPRAVHHGYNNSLRESEERSVN